MAAAMNRQWGRGSGWEGPKYRSQRRGRRHCHNRHIGLVWLVVALALSSSARPRASSSSPWPSPPASPFMQRSRSHVQHPVLVRGTAIETTDHASVDFGDPWDGG
uniref:Uncharacterized protein n=1 Tax=Arundo donax TaxID=35708 RepID=A0A0A9DM24_ARUDO